MLTLARTMLPAADFFELDISAATDRLGRLYDVVTCSGVLAIFDDLTIPVINLLKLCKPGGVVMITADINEANIDLITRYRNG